MLSINGFIENRKQKAAKAEEQKQRQLEAATLRRDVYGPHFSGKTRRQDVKILKDARPPVTEGRNTGEPLPPLTEGDIGDGFRSKQRKKALPKYNATRPPSLK